MFTKGTRTYTAILGLTPFLGTVYEKYFLLTMLSC